MGFFTDYYLVKVLNDIFTSFQQFYVINPDDYSIQLANNSNNITSKVKDITCYKLMHNRSKPCNDINFSWPVKEILKNRSYKTSQHVYTDEPCLCMAEGHFTGS